MLVRNKKERNVRNWLSTRVLGWMCYELDTPTYLMWATSCYIWQIWGEPVEDAWTDMHTGEPSAGDGKLTYPGAKYGIDGPCPSLRMVAYQQRTEGFTAGNVHLPSGCRRLRRSSL